MDEVETFRAKTKLCSNRQTFKKLTPNVATIFSQLRAKCKKSETDLVGLEAIL